MADVHAADGYPIHWLADPPSWLAPDPLLIAWVAECQETVIGHVALCRVVGELAAPLWSAASDRSPEHLATVAKLFVWERKPPMQEAKRSDEQGWHIQPAMRSDLPAALEFVAACERAEYGQPDTAMLEGIEIAWGKPDFEPSTDAWIARDGADQIVGYAHAGAGDPDDANASFFIHPEIGSAALGTALCQHAEARARARLASASTSASAGPARLTYWVAATNAPSHRALEAEGYEQARHIWGMELVLGDEPPHAAAWPAGLTVRTCTTEDHLRLAHATVNEAFQDHWGYVARSFEDYSQSMIQIAGFDPTLWFLVVEATTGVVVATALCEALPDRGWVNDLGVRRPWRGRGIGQALLQHAFAVFHARGFWHVGLGVDSQNLTGATRLYERVGMRIERQYDIYAKALSI